MSRRTFLLLPLLLLSCAPGQSPLAPISGDICEALSSAPVGAVPSIPGTSPIRVLAFGDFGTSGVGQHSVARAMAEVDRQAPFHFGITLGDNFYSRGLNSPTHPRWQTDWEDLYSRLGIRIYATLGNHDYRDPASPKAQIARSRLSKTWCLPRPYYTFVAGPVQFFAVDTDPIEKLRSSVDEQMSWLDGALATSRAPWKVVFGHHPVYTNGEHGGQAGFLPALRQRLLPVLKKHKVDVYLTGHDHDLQALKPEGGVRFFISGGGGRTPRPLQTNRCRDWGEGRLGFTVLEADGQTLTVTYFGRNGERLYEAKMRKGEAVEECVR
ncbi:MAG TPA: metallophosphoesterase [Thermoanaerobaculia bacterium]